MKTRNSASAAFLFMLLLNAMADAQVLTTTALIASPNSSTLGQAVTLTATVSESGATGTVTFYDGVSILGVSPLSSDQATLVTRLLPSGERALRAYYEGNASFTASTSTIVTHPVTPLPQAGFEAAVHYVTGNGPYASAAGDFNEDGKVDLAVANEFSNNVSVLVGNGDGTFQPATNYGVGTAAFAIAVGDFNRDGKADIVVANRFGTSSNVSVLLGNGDGTFQPDVNYSAGSSPFSVAVGDFDADGKADLAVANSLSANVSVLPGNGDGTFQTAIHYGVGNYPANVAVGDFNADARTDLAVANMFSHTLSVLLGNGDGTFQPAVHYSVGVYPYYVAVGDLNADGKVDVAVANWSSSNVSVLLGNGNGTFQTRVNYNAGSACQSVALGDFNADGKVDLVTANYTGNNVSVLLGNGDGTFQLPVNYGVGSGPRAAPVWDLNGDGRADLAVVDSTSNKISVLLGVAAAAPPHLTITKEHNDSFVQGQIGAAYTITVTNIGDGATLGTVNVADALPAPLTATAMSGTGWTCSVESRTCTRNDVLVPHTSFPPITLTVDVSRTAPADVTNTVTISGGNSANDVASDSAIVIPLPTITPFSGKRQGQITSQ